MEKRGHKYVRYADDFNVYFKSQRAGERVLESLTRYLSTRLRLVVNREKSAVDRPWKRSFLSYTVTWHRQPKLKVALLVERGRESYESGRADETTPAVGFNQPGRGTSASGEFTLNRRIRNRTCGGVRGRGR